MNQRIIKELEKLIRDYNKALKTGMGAIELRSCIEHLQDIIKIVKDENS